MWHAACGFSGMQPERKTWRDRALRVAGILFLLVALAVIVSFARRLDWQQVGESLASYPAGVLATGFVLALIGFTAFASYDLLSRHFTKHTVPPWETLAIAAVGYAFNLNLGTWVGSLGFRYRLYSRFGLKPMAISRIIGLGIVTNWSGFLLLAGVIFVFLPLPVPAQWGASPLLFQSIGGVLLVIFGAYVGVCATSGGRVWRVRGFSITTPPLPFAALQVALSCVSWLCMGTIVWLLLPGDIEFPLVMAGLAVASVGGVLLHIPGGLGVIEAVFVALLHDRLPEAEVIAAILGYRAIYFVTPFLLALLGYAGLEAHARRLDRRKRRTSHGPHKVRGHLQSGSLPPSRAPS